MIQVARRAPLVLGDSADRVRKFIEGRQNADGGFRGRDGRSDPYYTVFGMDGLLALEEQPLASLPETSRVRRGAQCYVSGFTDVAALDFVHVCCLIRCRAALGETGGLPELAGRLEQFRSTDGGYSPVRGADAGTAYGAFLAAGAYQDAKAVVPEPLRLVQSLKFLETGDGAWANDRKVRTGSTNATAAAVIVLRGMNLPVTATVGDWLMARCHGQGGFTAASATPVPDLLSTATALHALAALEVSTESIREPCLDFVDTLWTNEGGFHGHWADDQLDVEYTYYGLLALGHLSF